MRFSIRNKFLIALFGLSFLSLGISGISTITIISGTYVKEKEHSWGIIVDQLAQEATSGITYHQAVITRLVNSQEVAEYYQTYRLISLQRHFSKFADIFPVIQYINEQGVEELSSVQGKVKNSIAKLASNPLYLEAQKIPNQVVVSPPFYSDQLGEPVIGMGISLRPYFENRIVGTILAQVPLSTLSTPFSTSLQKEARVFFVDRKGMVIQGQKDVSLPPLLEVIPSDLISFEKAHVHHISIDGEDNLIVHSPIPSGSMHLAMVIPTYRFYSGVKKLITILLLVGCLALIVSVIGAYWLSRQITRPLKELNKGVKKISSGETVILETPESKDELSDLVEAFNDLSMNLETSMVSKNYFDTILNKTPNYLFVISEDDTILLINESTSILLNIDPKDLQAKNISAFLGDPPEGFSFWYNFAKASLSPIEKEVTTDLGQVPVYFSSSYLHLDETHGQGIFVGQDLRERKNLEKRLVHVQRLEALDSLVAGVNHEFGNLLAAILGFSELIREDSPADSQTRSDIDKVISSGIKAKNIIRQMQNFRKWHEDDHAVILPIGEAVEDILSILVTSLSRNIVFEKQILITDEKVVASTLDIRSIVTNLFYNALDAMGSNGSLEFSLEAQIIDSNEVLRHGLSAPGNYVILKVKDSGSGMDSKTLDQIFNPFFSTKEVGKGTGLGLSEVHGLVEKLGGSIYVESQPGQGSTFFVFFPVAKDGPAD